MSALSLFKRIKADQPIVEDITPRDINDKEATGVVQDSKSDTESEAVDTTAQHGVQKAEATTQVWSRSHLIMAYIL